MADPSADREWSRLHGDLDPGGSRWVTGWLRLVHRLARPLARRGVSPDALTWGGLAVSALVPPAAYAGAAWPLLACLLVVVAALLDGLDGAVAVQRGATSAWGRVLDPFADRCSDLLGLLALALLGAPGWLCVLLGALTLLLESVRSSAQVAGLAGVGAVTVWERPSRIIVVAFATGLVGLLWCVRAVGADPVPALSGAGVATGWAVAGLLLSVVGLVHLLRSVRRGLRPA